MGERREEENGRQGNGKRAGTSSKIRGSGERNAKSLLDFAEPGEKYLQNSRAVARLGAVFEQKKKKKTETIRPVNCFGGLIYRLKKRSRAVCRNKRAR